MDDINLEASNSVKCLQEACCHLLPIMQLAVTKMHLLLSEQSGNELTVSSIVCYVIQVKICLLVCCYYIAVQVRVKSESWPVA